MSTKIGPIVHQGGIASSYLLELRIVPTPTTPRSTGSDVHRSTHTDNAHGAMSITEAQLLTPQRLMRFGGVIMTLIVVLSAVALVSARRQQSALVDQYTITEVRSNLQTADMMHDAVRAVVFGSGLEAQLGADQIAALRTELDENIAMFQEAIDLATELPSTPEISALLQSAGPKVDAYGESSMALFGTLDDMSSADQTLATTAVDGYAAWVDSFEVLKTDMESLTETIGAESARILAAGRSTGQRSNLLIAIAAAFAAGVFVLVWRKVLAACRQSAALQGEMARVNQMVEGSPTAMVFADTDGVVRYMNPASVATLRPLEAHLPCKADDLIGRSAGFLPSTAVGGASSHVPLGREMLDLSVTPIAATDGAALGRMMSWSVITDQVRLAAVANAAQERERAQAAELQVKVDSLLSTMARAAAGDLTVEVTVIGDDAIGQMGSAMSKLLKDLRVSIAAIAGNSEALAAAAEELQVVSSQMGSNSAETSRQVGFVSDASVEVSRNIETVSAASEEMSSSIKEIARNASEAAKVATQAVEAAQVTNATVAKLGDSSTEIGQIVKVITGIAQQTNLLALNATIEAARAGEAGKGFAVVANEVKELAKETAKATKDISAKIEAIQTDTRSSVDSITGILVIIDQIAEFQNTIASAVEEQAATTNEIAHSVSDASRSSTEITNNMQAVSNAADSTSGGASDSSRAASELARMATDLQTLVGQFSY